MRAAAVRFLNDRLDWNLLRTFLVIMQERSVSRAAARLHVTQPAVSQALKRLEETLGHTLIRRRGPHFEPTQAGAEVYRIASDIYGTISRLDTELDDAAADLTGTIRLLSVSRIESGVYDLFLADFHRQYPRVDLQIEVMRSSDIISSLLQKTATAGLSLCRNPVDKLARAPFLRQRYAIYCGRHHRLPPDEGLIDVDIHLLWHRERKMNAAELAFLEGFERAMQRYSFDERLAINP